MEKRFSFLIILILILFACKKENKPLAPVVPESTINWKEFTLANSGLPELNITAIKVDEHNNKWIGTVSSGLVKFDGEFWTVFDSSNSGIPNEKITAIEVDVSGNIWLGIYYDYRYPVLIKFDETNCTSYDANNSALPDDWDFITGLKFDPSGVLWVGTYTHGVFKFDGMNWQIYNASNCLIKQDQIHVIAVDVNGHFWVGTDMSNRVLKFDGTNWTSYPKPDESATFYGYDVNGIVFDSQGNLWIDTGNELAKYDFSTWDVISSFGGCIPDGLLVDSDDNIWAAMLGLTRFDGNEVTRFEHPALVNWDNLAQMNCVDIDLHDNIWVGTDKGIFVFHEGGVILQ